MSGSARTLVQLIGSGFRVAGTTFTPEHNKNGNNISAKLDIDAYMNIASRANGGQGRSEILKFTVWGKLAHTCAKSMSRGKEFHAESRPRVFDKRVFFNRQPVQMADGTVLTVKGVSFTIERLIFGAESEKFIAEEIQAQVRPVNWNVAGHPENLQWKEILKARQAVAFDPQSPTYGYARVLMPQGAGIGPYVENQNRNYQANVAVNPAGTGAAVVPPVHTPATAAAGAAGVAVPPVENNGTTVAAGGFVIPGV